MQSLRVPQKDKFSHLRKTYPQFVYKSYKYDFSVIDQSYKIEFLFVVGDLEFRPKIKIGNITKSIYQNLEKNCLENFVFHLGLIEIPSYWKSTCSPIITIEAGMLNQDQLAWWYDLMINGLGEFFYQNKIDLNLVNFLKIESDSHKTFQMDRKHDKEGYIVQNGGGRDSVVTLELLKSQKQNISVLMLNPTIAALEVFRVSGIKDKIIIKRQLDPKLLELNKAGYLNGHTPFSAYLAFLSVLCAYIFDKKYTVASNERSSNEQNMQYQKRPINHQYSKSYTFEKSFRDYVKSYLSSEIIYFSSLRPLYEIQISKIFAKYKKYFSVFKSCNIGQKTNSWCCQCAKCLSIYISLYPFLTDKERTLIFPEDLYTNEKLMDLLLHLTGDKKPKPFECVGTYSEIIAGLQLSVGKFKHEAKQLPALLRYPKDKLSNKKSAIDVSSDWGKESILPKNFSRFLQEKLKNGS